MKNRRTLLVFSALVLLSVAAIAKAQSAAAAAEAAKMGVALVKEITGGGACTRHIYNDSHSVWKITGSAGSGLCEKGCGVAPGDNIPISYSGSTISIDLQSPGYHDAFTVKGSGNCVYIEHNGNTGRAVLNQAKHGPTVNGDIVFID